jgi:hypothetical protein
MKRLNNCKSRMASVNFQIVDEKGMQRAVRRELSAWHAD